MKTSYQISATATCPIDGAPIDYLITVTLKRSGAQAMLEVEKLLSMVGRLTEKPTMQEPLTRAVLEEVEALVPRCTVGVMTIGVHSGVEVTCEAGSPGA